jgi:hypothetical protein
MLPAVVTNIFDEVVNVFLTEINDNAVKQFAQF